MLLGFAILAVFAVRPRQIDSSGQDSPAIGKPAPRLDLVRLGDPSSFERLVSIDSDKVTLIHFWGTWCGPCKMEYPQLASLVDGLQKRPEFEFISISCEGGADETYRGLWQKTSGYFQSEGIEGVAFADPQGVSRRSAADRVERPSLFYPTTILVGPGGKIAGVWEGYSPDSVSQMGALATQLMNSSPAAN